MENTTLNELQKYRELLSSINSIKNKDMNYVFIKNKNISDFNNDFNHEIIDENSSFFFLILKPHLIKIIIKIIIKIMTKI